MEKEKLCAVNSEGNSYSPGKMAVRQMYESVMNLLSKRGKLMTTKRQVFQRTECDIIAYFYYLN